MDEDTRTLKIEIPPCYVSSVAGVAWEDLSGLNGWQIIPNTNTRSLYWKGTIDLSGYVRDYKTFFPSAGFLQEGAYWQIGAVDPVTAVGNVAITVVSSVPLNPGEVLTQLLANSGPGFLDLNLLDTGVGQQDWNVIMFAESQVNLVNQNILNPTGVLQPISTKQSGSLSATATDTLFVLKIVSTFADNPSGPPEQQYIGSFMSIPASRVIIPGKFGTEPDVEYMMRLKRSVELSQQV